MDSIYRDTRIFLTILIIILMIFISVLTGIGYKQIKENEKLYSHAEEVIADGYDVYLEGELKDAKTLDLSQYEISIDDENKIVKLTRNVRVTKN